MSIQEFYSVMINFLDQLALTELKVFGTYIACREHQWLVQFLTTLHINFEGLRGLILHRSPLPFIDSVVSELLAKEIRFQPYSEKEIIFTSNYYVLAVLSKPLSNNQNKHYAKVAFNECSFCKQKGHWITEPIATVNSSLEAWQPVTI